MKEEIPQNILLKTQYLLYKTIKPNIFSEISLKLFNYVANTKPENQDKIEIEIKLGKFKFDGDYSVFNRIKDVFIIPEFKFSSNSNSNKMAFEANVGKHFNLLWFYIDNEAKFDTQGVKLIEPLYYKEFIFSGEKRLSFCYNGDNILLSKEIISKTNKNHINVKYNNNLDLRITAATEEPRVLEERDYDSIPKTYREKLRLSYRFFFYRFDLTIVRSIYNSSKLAVFGGGKAMDSDFVSTVLAEDLGYFQTTYEFEIEFEGLNHYLKNSKLELNSFEKLISRMVENAYILIESITKIEIFENLPNKIDVFEKFIHKNPTTNETINLEGKENKNELKKLSETSILGNYFKLNN